MSVREISVLLDNAPAKLSEMADCLRENGVTILALSVVSRPEATTVRMVTTDPEKTANTLRTHSYQITEKEVLALELPDHPGGLNAVLRPFKEKSLEIHSIYACFGSGEKTRLIVDVNRISDAILGLEKTWVRVLDGKDL